MTEEHELDIGALENETIFIPNEGHDDPEARALMHMGKVGEDSENALRDPWLDTDEGHAWLAERGES